MDTDALVAVVKRASALTELANGPMDRRDLEAHLGVSRPTVHRLLRALGEEGLIERVDGEVVLTGLGEAVTEEVVAFERNVRSARRLAPVLNTFRDLPIEFDAEQFADATVTSAEPTDPYRPVNRFMSILSDTGTVRGIDPASINPLHVDELNDAIIAGMETDAIYPPAVVENLVGNFPERARKAFESGNLTLRTHEETPFGLTICDDRVGLGIYDDDTGLLTFYVDTDAPGARAWALDVYESYLAEAERFDWTAERSET